MDRNAIRRLLEEVQAGRLDVEAAAARLRRLPYEDLRFAKVDHHRALRGGAAEAVFCPGKSPGQVVAIVRRLAEHHANVLATRAGADVAAAVAAAGTADLPVAEEAALVAEALDNRVERVYDCGVAGLHRLLDHYDLLAEANAIVAVAGMEGALPSVIGGLVDRPVIAVPTSVGYGASLGGLAALLAMLNSCAPGVSVVNIDNGYGAAHQASQINHLVAKVR